MPELNGKQNTHIWQLFKYTVYYRKTTTDKTEQTDATVVPFVQRGNKSGQKSRLFLQKNKSF